jgi:hypothetical protein
MTAVQVKVLIWQGCWSAGKLQQRHAELPPVHWLLHLQEDGWVVSSVLGYLGAAGLNYKCRIVYTMPTSMAPADRSLGQELWVYISIPGCFGKGCRWYSSISCISESVTCNSIWLAKQALGGAGTGATIVPAGSPEYSAGSAALLQAGSAVA